MSHAERELLRMRETYTVTIRPRRVLVWSAALGGGLAVIVAMLWLAQAPLLEWVGDQLLHEDSMADADVIVVLSGGTPAREIEAADLYRAGYAPRVVLTTAPPRASVMALRNRGVHAPNLLEERLRYMAELGVSHEVISVMPEPVSSTRQESELVSDWVRQQGLDRVILVTSGYHTARARWVFERALDEHVSLRVRPDSLEPFDPQLWWRDRNMLRNGLFEWQKLIFYRLWYR